MGKKILLADDSITIQKVIELTFSDEDFDVVTVGNGRLALERLPEVRPDIVLCDIIMPEKDGYEVCEQIKSSPTWSHLPVLLLTGAFEPFDQERATRAGYDGSLAKPFEPETLVAKVKELLARVPRPAPARPATVEAPASGPVPAASFVAPQPNLPSPPSLSFTRPADLSEPTAPLASAFIPEEPFSGLDDTAFASESAGLPGAPPVTPPRTSAAPLAEISEEESAALAPPAFEEEMHASDSVSTVMFRASDLPWASPAPAAPVAAPAAPSVPAPPSAPEPELVLEPAPPPDAGSSELVEEPAVFEAVLEEDLEFGSPEYVSEAEPLSQPMDEPMDEPMVEPFPDAQASPELEDEEIFAPEVTARSVFPQMEEGASGAFAALIRDQVPLEDGAADTAAFRKPAMSEEPATALEPESGHRAEPEPIAPAEPIRAAASASLQEPDEQALPEAPLIEVGPDGAAVQATTWESEDLSLPEPEPFPSGPRRVLEPQTPERGGLQAGAQPSRSRALSPPAGSTVPDPSVPHLPEGEQAALPVAAAVPAVSAAFSHEESFGDVAEAVIVDPPEAPASEAATLRVPVETVEKIAQRVVAQISEKAVREIAWEVIPDLAEALIKQEIEKLKVEISKL
jgi:CheY-like chemotaxis protein